MNLTHGWVSKINSIGEAVGKSHFMKYSEKKGMCGVDLQSFNWTLHITPRTPDICENCLKAYQKMIK
jgi:hypothetical protein